MEQNSIFIVTGLNGLPYVMRSDNADLWASEEVTLALTQASVNLINMGYKGIKIIDAAPIKKGGKKRIGMHNLPDTPEGLIMQMATNLCRAGYLIPFDIILANIEAVYEQEGLELPYPKKSSASI